VFQPVLPLHECYDPAAVEFAASKTTTEPLHSVADSAATEPLQSVVDFATTGAGVASTKTS
jgi:hypothetical protein